MNNYLGNSSLLNLHKIGFLASRRISTLSVLPTLDWAAETAKCVDVAVVSGFHSRLERDVLKFLLRGRCGIIIVLARGIYKTIPEQYREAYSANRVLFISNEKPTVTRTSELTCHRRNDYVRSISDDLKFINNPS